VCFPRPAGEQTIGSVNVSRATTERPSLVLAVLSAAILLDALDLSITQVALPSVQRELALSAGVLPWVASGYALTYGGFLLLGGRAADLYGRRAVFLGGLVVFGVMSVAAGLAPNAGLLIAARAVQGIGAALTVPAAVSIITTGFAEGAERNRALGVFAASGSAGFSVGLVLGGVLTDLLGWRWIFLVKVPIVALVVGAALLALPRPTAARTGRQPIDVAGAVCGTGGLLLLVLVVTQAAEPTLAPALLVAVAVAAVLLLAGFVVVERWSADPLLPFAIFRNRTVRSADLASLTVLAAPFGFSYVATLYLQDVLRYGPLVSGLALLPGAVLSIVVSRWVAPTCVNRFGLRVAGVTGLLLVAAGFALLLRLGPETGYGTGLLPAVVVCFGLGMGIAYPVFTIAAVSGVDDESQGLAAGIQSTALQVGGGLGLALVSGAVAVALGSGEGPATVEALRVGAAAGTALPLLGAVVTAIGLRGAKGD
jgi:EmrB/QacA subfamily drug resistance transporter